MICKYFISAGKAKRMFTEKEIGRVWPEYICEEEIGSGAYGKVFRISDRDGGKKGIYALKCTTLRSFPAPGSGRDKDQAAYERDYEMFVKASLGEVEIMMKLSACPCIVRICEYRTVERPGVHELDLYIRMEYLTSLTDYLLYHDADEKMILKMGSDLCRALEACEKAGVVHRDIRPENIFVTGDGAFKLGDFGMAGHVLGTEDAYIRLGTYEYAAPEAFKREKAGHLSDQYSLGLVLYRLLNGNRIPLLQGRNSLMNMEERKKAVLARLRGEKLPPPSEASPAAARVILKACSPEPGKRFSDSAAFRKALEDPLSFAAGEDFRRRAAAAALVCFLGIGVFLLVRNVPRLKTDFSPEPPSSEKAGENYASGIFETLDREEVQKRKRKEGRPVTFHDSVLEEAVREEIAAYDDRPVTREEMENIAELRLGGLAIGDFQDLALCTGLRYINLEDTLFSDTGLLSSMSGLEEACLGGCPVETIEGLEGLEKLTYLDLSGSALTDEGTRQRLLQGQIRYLDLSDTGISGLDFLAFPEMLEHLQVENTGIRDLSMLERCGHLTLLDLGGTEVDDISFLLKASPALEELDLSDTRVMDLAPLTEMYSLKSLDLTGTGITDISPLSGLAFLETLRLGEGIYDDLYRKILPRGLKSLKVSSLRVTDISFLSSLPDLCSLDISGTKIKDLEALAGTGIEVLDLSGTDADSYSVLGDMPELRAAVAENVPEECREVLASLDVRVFYSREEFISFMESE
jgi:serine/threonine protein kinase